MKREKKEFLQKNGWLLFFSLAGGSLFILMLANVLVDGPMLNVDAWLSIYAERLQTKTWTQAITFVTDLNGVIASSLLFAVITVFFWYKKWYRDLGFFLLSFIGATLLFNFVKFTLQRTRPDTRLFDLVTYSFPSGHTTMATVLALSLYFIFRKRVSDGLPRVLLLLAAILWPVTIAFTRVYLNVHWASDVLAGLGLGLFWVTLICMLYPPRRT